MLLPKLFREAKDFVLGPGYELSFALISRRRAAALNRRYRGKDRPADILSFPLDKEEGEILINKDLVPEKKRLILFIHGLLHLKGLVHGSKMDRKEQAIISILTHHGKNNSRRTRHRYLGHSARGRRGGPRK